MAYTIRIDRAICHIIKNCHHHYAYFIFAGNADSETIYLKDIKREPFWGGSKEYLLNPFNYGEYKVEVLDKASGSIVYSKGFCTLFEEWQTTSEANSRNKAFYQSVVVPYPKNKVLLNVYSRNWGGDFIQVYQLEIDPEDYFINPEKSDFEYKKIVDHGDPSEKVDVVFIAEGYTASEMDKFEKDSKRFLDFLFTQKPFDQYKQNFNIWIVKSVSEESGTDIPGEGIYKKTAVNSNFYTFDSERYLTTEDFFAVSNIASAVPYDDICILVNTDKYGGGGIYNHYSIFSADHPLSEIVFVHEFGHSFAALADEYYTSSTSYNDFFNLEIEPWQANLTTLKDFEKKWKDQLDESTPVPTPRVKSNKNKIGVYEGGGYVHKGMFSPYMDCRMKTNEAKDFCPVCQEAIIRMILSKSK
jgi:hypothetical protein